MKQSGKNKTKLELIKLDLSFGDLPAGHQFIRPKGFNPEKYPWNLKNESVEEAHSALLLNRIPGPDRGKFMDELWRVLVPNGKATIIVPYWTHPKNTIDPAFQYPAFSELSFLMFNKGWRESQNLKNTCTCDFDFGYGYNLDQETLNRNDETRPFWIKHYLNTAVDLHVTLTKKP